VEKMFLTLTMRLEVKERGEEVPVWQPGIWVSKLIEEGMN